MALIVGLWQEDAPEVRMAAEPDSHEVVGFAFHEFGALPDADDGGDRRVSFGHAGFDAQAHAVGQREDMVDDFEPFRVLGIIGRTDVGNVVEG